MKLSNILLPVTREHIPTSKQMFDMMKILQERFKKQNSSREMTDHASVVTQSIKYVEIKHNWIYSTT